MLVKAIPEMEQQALVTERSLSMMAILYIPAIGQVSAGWSWGEADFASAADGDAQVSECAGVSIQPAQLTPTLRARTRG